MSDIEKELKELIVNLKKEIDGSESSTEDLLGGAQNLSPALNLAYDKFKESIDLFNKELGAQVLSIENISVEIFKLLLNFEDIKYCFFLSSKDRLVFVFNEGEDQITFFGKNKLLNNNKANPRFIQLFKLGVNSANNTTGFKDNTGRTINIEEVILQIIRWLVS